MKVIVYILFVSFAIGHFVATTDIGECNGLSEIQKPDQTCGSHFDILIKELLFQNWEDDRLCLDQLLHTIDNAKNATLWATWVWDSMQLPVGQLYGSRNHLGNYDQCLREKVGSSRLPFSMQFCLADILLQYNTVNISPEMVDAFGSADAYVKSMTVLEQRFNEMSWGLCVPRVCKAKSVERFARAFLKQSHLGYLQSPDNITINCEFPHPERIGGTTILFVFMLLPVIMVVACTVYASVRQKENSFSYADTILRCFCLKRNVKELMKRPTNDVNVLHGMRFVSCAMIVLLHVIFLIYNVTAANGLDFEEKLHSYAQIILHFIIFVDTFFVMSGLLFMRNIKKNCTIRDLIDATIKRYFRLIWWYIANVMIIFFVLPNSGCGPLCSKFVSPEKQNCHKTWWSGLLMITNYYDVYSVCVSFSWYIFCDFQMSVAASIVFWIYQRHKRVGVTCFTIFTILSILLPGYFTYFGEAVSFIPFKFDIYRTFKNKQTAKVLTRLYSQTHFRANPYLMGVMMGYIMSNYNAEDIRHFFTKKRVISGVLGSTLIVIAILVAYVNGSDSLKNALLISLHRPFWAMFMCALIGVCEYGNFSIVKDVLSWNGLVPLSKLTYGIYMVNFTTIAASLISTRSTLHFNEGIWIEKFLAHLMLCTLISLFFMLFVESPLNNVVRIVLSKRGNNNLITSDAIVKNRANGIIQNGSNGIKTNITTTYLSQSKLQEKKL